MAKNEQNTETVKVSDWMSHCVLAVEIYDSISIARRLMAKHRINQLPVLDNDRLVGIVTDRDIRDAYPTSMLIGRPKEIDRFADSYTVEEAMTHNVFTVRPETPLVTAIGILRRHRVGSLPVVKNKNLVGIITRSDILDYILSGTRRSKSALLKRKAPKPRARKKRRAY